MSRLGVMLGLKQLLILSLGAVALTGHAQTVEYIHTDALGTPVAVTNSAGTVIERSEYEPYGKVLNRPVKDGPGYTGHVEDAATGLTYMQQRYYDPTLGRFLSVDPVTANGNTGGNFNRYWYANNNPYKFVDPDGREVVITIARDTYTIDSITSRISVTSDKTDRAFSGFALEDSRGGHQRQKDPLMADTYSGKVRTDGGRGWRIELEPKNNYANVQLHIGNTAIDVEGCFAPGAARHKDRVTGSKAALKEMKSIVEADGSGKITINVQGSSTKPPREPPPPPPPRSDENARSR